LSSSQKERGVQFSAPSDWTPLLFITPQQFAARGASFGSGALPLSVIAVIAVMVIIVGVPVIIVVVMIVVWVIVMPVVVWIINSVIIVRQSGF
jgi:hypothetical protein